VLPGCASSSLPVASSPLAPPLQEKFTRFATIATAITGQAFVPAARTVFETLRRNFLQTYTMWCVLMRVVRHDWRASRNGLSIELFLKCCCRCCPLLPLPLLAGFRQSHSPVTLQAPSFTGSKTCCQVSFGTLTPARLSRLGPDWPHLDQHRGPCPPACLSLPGAGGFRSASWA
jgi:hypothetical protein